MPILVKKPLIATIGTMKTVRQGLYNLVRASDKIFKVDMVYITKGGFWNTLRFGVGIAASLATMIAFGNLVSKETYGTYNYLLSLASTFGFLTLSGMSAGVIRAVARGGGNILPYALKMQLRYNLLAVAGIALAAIYYGVKGNGIFALSLGILSLAVPFSAAYHTYESFLIGKKRFDSLSLLTSLSSIAAAGATVVTLFYTQNIIVLVAVFGAISLIPNMLIYYYIERGTVTGIPQEKEIAELRRTAFHLTGAGLISAIAQYVDKILLFQVAGPATLAIYGFAIAGPERIKGLAKNWVSIVLPRLAERSIEEIKKVFYQRLAISLVIGICLSSLYIVIAPFIFDIFLPQYLSATLYSQIYSLSAATIPAAAFVGYVFYGQNMLRAVYLNSTFSQIIRISLFVILGWRWHIWGLIFAAIISSVASVVCSIVIWEIESRRIQKHE